MLTGRQRIALCLLAALSVVTLLHAHAALDASSVHCNACIQQSHVNFEPVFTLGADVQVRPIRPDDPVAAPDLILSWYLGSRAPPA